MRKQEEPFEPTIQLLGDGTAFDPDRQKLLLIGSNRLAERVSPLLRSCELDYPAHLRTKLNET